MKEKVGPELFAAQRGDDIDPGITFSGNLRADLLPSQGASVSSAVSEIDPAFVDINPVFQGNFRYLPQEIFSLGIVGFGV